MTRAFRYRPLYPPHDKEGLLMTGLNEVVWYTSWYWKLLTRGVLIAVITSIVAYFLLFERASYFVLLLIFVM